MVLKLQLAVELPGGLVTTQIVGSRVSDSVCLGGPKNLHFQQILGCC